MAATFSRYIHCPMYIFTLCTKFFTLFFQLKVSYAVCLGILFFNWVYFSFISFVWEWVRSIFMDTLEIMKRWNTSMITNWWTRSFHNISNELERNFFVLLFEINYTPCTETKVLKTQDYSKLRLFFLEDIHANTEQLSFSSFSHSRS